MTIRSSLCLALGCALALPMFGASCSPADGRTIFLGGSEDAGSLIFADASAETETDAGPPEPLLACIGTECPYPYQTCPDANGALGYKCGSSLLTDDNNCGQCGNVCPSYFTGLQMDSHCVNGKCQSECVNIDKSQNDFEDCNGIVDDGCEIDIANDPNNCGVCGTKCPNYPDGTAQPCTDHHCGCPAGKTYCSGIGCVDLASDGDNCGTCANACPAVDKEPPTNAGYACRGGKCGQLICFSGWADCNNDLDDGCETDILSNSNCGACGIACDPGQTCTLTPDNNVLCLCPPNLTLCGNTCVDLMTDPSNCGVCQHKCPAPTADPRVSTDSGHPTCQMGFCGYECGEGWGDCDGDGTCETDLRVDGLHCGSCGHQCDTASGQPCIGGSCLMIECTQPGAQ